MIDVEAVKAKVERKWNRGELCRAVVKHGELFPWSIALGKPSSKQLLDDFSAVQGWVKSIQTFAQKKQLTLAWQTINHRALGAQRLPAAIDLETPKQAARLIGQSRALQQFEHLYHQSIKSLPELQPWIIQYPLKLLALENVWQQILNLCVWMRSHPNPRMYMRQVDVAGVDSKFIEQHKKVLADLFDLLLPVYAIDDDFSGAAGFARRYGFLDKPVMLRLRTLDSKIALLHSSGDQDAMITEKAFAALDVSVLQQVKQVVMVENEINYLTFPAMDETLIIFGSGYGFEALKKAKWLHDCALYYWGDLDTHSFAILNQLRAVFPQTTSFLMDKNTLVKHQHAWGTEPKQETKDLKHLNQKEADMYDDLRNNRLTSKLRLEQERIAYSDVLNAVEHIIETPQSHGESNA